MAIYVDSTTATMAIYTVDVYVEAPCMGMFRLQVPAQAFPKFEASSLHCHSHHLS